MPPDNLVFELLTACYLGQFGYSVRFAFSGLEFPSPQRVIQSLLQDI